MHTHVRAHAHAHTHIRTQLFFLVYEYIPKKKLISYKNFILLFALLNLSIFKLCFSLKNN